MKTIEEKAKAYDEALERAKQIRNGNPSSGTAIVVCEQIFPDLKESEDERIRKEIIDYFESRLSTAEEAEILYFKCWISYLERQKKDKVELVYRMNGLMQDYIKEGKDDEEKEHRFKCYQLFWDALVDANFFEQKEQKPTSFNEPYNPDEYEVVMEGSATSLKRKEQKPVDDDPLNDPRFIDGFDTGREVQKIFDEPVKWSEEDERILKGIIGKIDHDQTYGVSKAEMLSFLKRVRPQMNPIVAVDAEQLLKILPKRQEWSKEDKETIEILKKILKVNHPNGKFKTTEAGTIDVKYISTDEVISRLESLRPQSKIEWTGADIDELKHTKLAVTFACTKGFMDVHACDAMLNWLDTHAIPHWKPSEEQMEALRKAVNKLANTDVADSVRLSIMYDNLKKL